MTDERRRRGTPPTGTLIGPLLMLVCGAVTGLVLWRVLMLEPELPRRDRGQLTQHDRRAADPRLH